MRNAASWLLGGALLVSGMSLGAARAGDIDYGNLAAPYLQRSDKIDPGAGDAKETNAATHVIDPWPRYVGNRNIPGNGERMVGAVTRYRDVSKLPLAPRPLPPVDIGITGFSSGGSGVAIQGTTR